MLLQIIILSFMFVLPLGPGAFVVMNSGVVCGRWHGLKVACGCILSDIIWISCSVWFPIFHHAVANNMHLIAGFGGFFVLGIGLYIRFFFTEEHLAQSTSFRASFFATIFNPTILVSSTILLVKFVDGYYDFSTDRKMTLVLGTGIGEILWWGLLLTVLNCFRSSISIKGLAKTYGVIIMIGGGIWLLKSFGLIPF